jgi:hypothetical protein
MLATANTLAVTMDEAAVLFDAGKWAEAASAYQDIVKREPANAPAQFRLARASAANGDLATAMVALKAWVDTGRALYQAAMQVPELALLREDSRFIALIEPLRPCNTPEFRQFDFWVGEWDVASAATNQRIGLNRISRINGGCTLREEYVTPAGYEGTSLSFYDSERKVWHQTWIDNQGGALYLEGGLDGNSMLLSTGLVQQSFNRVTWSLLPDGRVRQHWQSTEDGGTTWSTVFDGYYSRRQDR